MAEDSAARSDADEIRRRSQLNEAARLDALLQVSRLRLLATLPGRDKWHSDYGQPPPRAQDQLLQGLAHNAVIEGFYDAIDREATSRSDYDFRIETHNAVIDATDNFRNEVFGIDPLRILQLSNQPLFQEFDRRRAERELRASISLPLMVVICAIANQTSNPYIYALLILPVSLFASSALDRDNETVEIFRTIGLGDVETPALKSARFDGTREAHRVNLEAARRNAKDRAERTRSETGAQ